MVVQPFFRILVDLTWNDPNGDAVAERLVNKLSDEAKIGTFLCKLTGFTTSKRVIRNKYLEISEFRIGANKKSLKMNFYFFFQFFKN